MTPGDRLDVEAQRCATYFTIGLAAFCTYLVEAWVLGVVALGVSLWRLIVGLRIERDGR